MAPQHHRCRYEAKKQKVVGAQVSNEAQVETEATVQLLQQDEDSAADDPGCLRQLFETQALMAPSLLHWEFPQHGQFNCDRGLLWQGLGNQAKKDFRAVVLAAGDLGQLPGPLDKPTRSREVWVISPKTLTDFQGRLRSPASRRHSMATARSLSRRASWWRQGVSGPVDCRRLF